MTKKIESYTEPELMDMFGLTRLLGNTACPAMARWTAAPAAQLTASEIELLEDIYTAAVENIIGWQEEDLKMQFISPILLLSKLKNTKKYLNFFERTLEATVDNYFLKTKTDFMIASGSVGIFKLPYFHFQVYKSLNSSPFEEIRRGLGDSMGQLLEAFLIAQHQNKTGKPIYGCEVTGATWRFVVMQDRTYCVSDAYDSTNKVDLLQIIAVLRHFKHILETELL